MPSQNRIRSKQSSDFGKSFVAEDFSFDSHPATLVIAQQDASLSPFFSENSILGSQILDHFLLLTIHPPGEHNQDKLPRLQDKFHDSLMPRKSNANAF